MGKFGIFSDIHANLAALEAVLQHLDDERCDACFCVGDVVGYGASPADCIDLLRERDIPCVLGNHDHYVTSLLDDRLKQLRKDVRASIQWTQENLDMDQLKWLAQLPRYVDVDMIHLVHGAYGPHPWLYLTKADRLAKSFPHQPHDLAFCGHTHVPAIGLLRDGDSAPVLDYLKSGPIPDADKVIVNPGSVGQPRDRDPRAACLIFDTEANTVRLFRVPYDIDHTQKLIRDAKLPDWFAVRLELGR